jgi:hypothetical protein
VSPAVGLQVLTDDTFEHLTQAVTGATTGDWFVGAQLPLELWSVRHVFFLSVKC